MNIFRSIINFVLKNIVVLKVIHEIKSLVWRWTAVYISVYNLCTAGKWFMLLFQKFKYGYSPNYIIGFQKSSTHLDKLKLMSYSSHNIFYVTTFEPEKFASACSFAISKPLSAYYHNKRTSYYFLKFQITVW